jgi:hypothetical protein
MEEILDLLGAEAKRFIALPLLFPSAAPAARAGLRNQNRLPRRQ